MDGGHSWDLVFPSPSDMTAFRAIAFSPSDPLIVYAGIGGHFNVGVWDSATAGEGVYVSRDGGKRWSPANRGLAEDANVSDLVVNPSDARILFAATTNHGLLRSTDGAVSWTQVSGGLPAASPILSLAVSPGDPSVLLAGMERGAVYRSGDGGNSWRRTASGLSPEASVTDIVFDPNQSGRVVYLSDVFSGVFRSLDGGLTCPS